MLYNSLLKLLLSYPWGFVILHGFESGIDLTGAERGWERHIHKERKDGVRPGVQYLGRVRALAPQ